MRRVVEQLQAAVAVHGLGHVDEQRVRHRVAGVFEQRIDDGFGVVPGRASVPQAEWRQSIGVHVLR